MRWTVAFSIWTVFVWAGRVRNVVADASIDGLEVAWRLGLACTFLAFAFATLALLARTRGEPSTPLLRVIRSFAIFTTLVWVVRAGGILLDGSHPAGFKIVHTLLAIVSIALAWQADRESVGHDGQMLPASRSVRS